MSIKESRRPAFEQAVIDRMKEGGFLEVEIRVECLARSGDGYYDGSVDAYWHFWNAALDGAPAQQVSAPMEADTVDAPWMSADTEPEIAWRDGFNACRARWLAAAPAAPAADAGLVDMYRHLQKVTPYRFKKIQDASVTDGGDVLYFHKDRFDAALLDDMAAHSAKGVV